MAHALMEARKRFDLFVFPVGHINALFHASGGGGGLISSPSVLVDNDDICVIV